MGMLLKGSHLRCLSFDELFTDSSRVHVLGLPSLIAFSMMDIMWLLGQSHFHESYLCSLKCNLITIVLV